MTGEAPPRLGSRSMLSCPRNVYRCRDGKHVALSASVQAVAERLLHAIGRPDLIDDPRFATNEARVQNDDVLDPVIADFIAAMTRGEALAHFTAADVTVGPVLDISELVDHPYLVDREVLAEYPDDEIGALPMHHVSPQLSATPGVIHSPAPALGQHTAEILAWIGLDGVAVERLRQDRVI